MLDSTLYLVALGHERKDGLFNKPLVSTYYILGTVFMIMPEKKKIILQKTQSLGPILPLGGWVTMRQVS